MTSANRFGFSFSYIIYFNDYVVLKPGRIISLPRRYGMVSPFIEWVIDHRGLCESSVLSSIYCFIL